MGGSLAYRTLRPVDGQANCYEFGVRAHGPVGPDLADRMATQIQVWDQRQRGGSGPVFTVCPVTTPDERSDGDLMIEKDHIRVSVRWP